MYKFTYYFREADNLREIASFILPDEDAIKFVFGASASHSKAQFDRGFVHSEEHPCTLKEGQILRLRITHASTTI